MTQARSRAHWSGVPSLSHHWMAALLRLIAMLVANAATFLRMRSRPPSGECHTEATVLTLPAANNGKLEKETEAATHSQVFKAAASQRASFSGERSASRESRFERQWDRRGKAQSPSSRNRDSRDALLRSLPENDGGGGSGSCPGTQR